MIAGLDSSGYRPTDPAVQSARNAGVGIWSGYLATREGVGLGSPWDRNSFDIARKCGATPLAYCSGFDDPEACKKKAADWNVRLCLDVEDGIRKNGPWVQDWLDASGAGLYGNFWVFDGRKAPFYVLTAFVPADPAATWGEHYCPRPAGHCGWQWRGTHDDFGGAVDSSWFDEWFSTGSALARTPPRLVAAGGGEGSMILLSASNGRTHRLIVSHSDRTDAAGNRGGPVVWISIAGGAGGLDAWPGGDGQIGGDGGWIAAGTLAAELWFWTEQQRELLIVQGRGLDGATWQKVVFTDNFAVHEEWHHVNSPAICVPGAPRP